MSDLDNAINSINASAAKAENTATFLDDMSTFDDQSSVTNPNNGQTVASIPKQVKDRTDELFTAAESDINQAVADAEQSATDAQDAADSIGRYQGLWPDTGGEAFKGDTYQTQVSGTPTGQYFTALQNTAVDPVGDDVNWREVVNTESVTTAQNDIVGGSIFKGSNGEYVQNGDTIPVGTTHLRVLVGGNVFMVKAWSNLILPASVTAMSTSDNGFSGYDVVTDQGTFEFISEKTREYRLKGDVRGWGALPAIDSTLSIVKAANSSMIVLIEEDYLVSGPIHLYSYSKLMGYGSITSTNQNSSVIRVIDATGFEARDVRVGRLLEQPGPNNDTSNIYLNGCDNFLIDNVKGEISQFGTVINIQKSSNGLVNKCKVSSYDLFDPSILQTALTSTSPNGIYVGDECRDIIVDNNICKNLGHGIAIQNVGGTLPIYNITVTNNNISECSSYGIFSYRLSESVYNVTISDNVIENIYGTYYNSALPSSPYTHGSGIYGQAVYRHTIRNNLIRNCCVKTANNGTLSPAGIGFAEVSDFIVSNNIISLSGQYGIICDGERNIISDNIVKETFRAMVYLRGSYGTLVSGNNLYGYPNFPQGILTVGTSGGLGRHDYLRVTDNFIQDSTLSISPNYCYDSNITGNIIEALNVSNNQGIGSDSNGENLKVSDNILKINGGFGIRVPYKSKVTDNHIEGAASNQSITTNQDSYYSGNVSDYTGVNTPYYEQTLTSANILTLNYLTDNIRINLSDNTNDLHAISNIPEGSTVYLRVPEGVTIKNLHGVTGFRFRFPDGLDRVTSKTTLFCFTCLFGGILDCTSEL